MVMQQTQQQLPAEKQASVTSLWRELVAENPIYRRELLQVLTPSNLTEEKVNELREKRREELAAWEALPLSRKIWRRLRPQLFVFGIAYILVPLTLQWVEKGIVGGMIGPISAGCLSSASAAATAIASERERRTWNSLLLSGFTPAQILGGKAAHLLKTQLIGQATLFTIGLAAAACGLIPLLAVVLVLIISLCHSLLATLMGLRISLWSPSVAVASKRAMWQGFLLAFLAFGTVLATLLPLLGTHSLALLLVPVVYVLSVLYAANHLWKRLLDEFYQAPKDFSG